MIGLLHAYSRTNPGDGLLLDLTLRRLSLNGVRREDVVLVALDPESFPEVPRRVKVGARGRGLSPELGPAAGHAVGLYASALTGRPIGRPAHELAACTALVAVGGGYLRSVDVTSSVGTLLNHLPQLSFAARAEVPSLYLPQTTGPLRGPVGRAVIRGLRRIDAVCVRDPWSKYDLRALPQVRRLPDLAVLDVAERWDEINTAESSGQTAIVASLVRHAPGYERHLRGLATRLGDRAVWAVHKTGHPTKSDAVHYERLGIAAAGGLSQMLARRQLSLVVSVRLHAALMAIAAGVPAIHLAYDRKGPGAFEDLGLADWCLDVRSLDPEALDAAVDDLLSNPEGYWEQLVKRVPMLRKASADLDALLGELIR